MWFGSQGQRVIGTVLFVLVAGSGAAAAENANSPTLTIGGVVYTDVRDPVRTGLQGVIVQVQGDKGNFEAVTAGVIGLWKMDVPQGTYTVTPKKAGYQMEHLVRGWCDGQRAITIEVNRKNLPADQSIQFLAVYWPEPNMPKVAEKPVEAPAPVPKVPAEAPRTERTGGGCAAAPERRGDAGAFFAPYVACVAGLLIPGRLRARRHDLSRKQR
jgi:hypothetical protein